jgi:membrane-associated HD superfamily phosphohydrolase
MSKGLTSNDKFIDEQLADFTDQVMANQAREISAPDDEDMLRELQSIVLEISQSVSQVTTDQEITERIQRNLIQTWQQETNRKETVITRITNLLSPRQTGWQSASQRRRRVAVQFALAVVIVLAFLIPLTQTQEPLSGAAMGNTGLAVVILILLIAGSVTAWYWWRRKK